MRATVSIAFVLMLLTVTEAAAGSWCATYSKRGTENCTYTSMEQCRAQVLGLGGWCRPNPFPNTAFGTGGTWSGGPRR